MYYRIKEVTKFSQRKPYLSPCLNPLESFIITLLIPQYYKELNFIKSISEKKFTFITLLYFFTCYRMFKRNLYRKVIRQKNSKLSRI